MTAGLVLGIVIAMILAFAAGIGACALLDPRAPLRRKVTELREADRDYDLAREALRDGVKYRPLALYPDPDPLVTLSGLAIERREAAIARIVGGA